MWTLNLFFRAVQIWIPCIDVFLLKKVSTIVDSVWKGKMCHTDSILQASGLYNTGLKY